jgi:Putative zinc-finger
VRHNHDEATIGAYLAGELPANETEAFEAHLLSCDRCWAEIHAGRRGRAIAQQAREPTPEQLRDRVLATVIAQQRPQGRRRPATRILVTACIVLVAVVATAIVAIRAVGLDTGQPVQIAAAVTDYLDQRLPGSGIPAQAGPDLSALHMVETGAGTGQLAGQPVTGYVYRDDTGRRLLIYLSDQPFPMPAQTDPVTDPASATITTHRGVAVLCSRAPHTVLILGADQQLVRQAATTLNLI